VQSREGRPYHARDDRLREPHKLIDSKLHTHTRGEERRSERSRSGGRERRVGGHYFDESGRAFIQRFANAHSARLRFLRSSPGPCAWAAVGEGPAAAALEDAAGFAVVETDTDRSGIRFG
jgi:hypothetical protein